MIYLLHNSNIPSFGHLSAVRCLIKSENLHKLLNESLLLLSQPKSRSATGAGETYVRLRQTKGAGAGEGCKATEAHVGNRKLLHLLHVIYVETVIR